MGLAPSKNFLKMGLHQELPVYKASYDLLVEIFRFTKEFSKEYKYTVGESLKKETTELLTLIYRANSKTDKHATLQDAKIMFSARVACVKAWASEQFKSGNPLAL